MITQRSLEIADLFSKYVKTKDKSLIEKIQRKELEFALKEDQIDGGCPHYKAMEKRLKEMKAEAGELDVEKDNE